MLRNLKHFNPAEVEEKVLKLWKEKHIFEKTLKPKSKNSKIFRFWEGPPYANGRPGIHHVLARVLKDVFLRYKTMQGYVVPRKAGWDTQGLPIEIEVEKSLGISTKAEIEKIGIEKFNEKAKEIIFRFKDEFEKLTEHIGYWLDLKNAYITYYPNYIESLWWVIKRLHERNFLKEFYRVIAYCPRCQTPLSNHELGMPGVYKIVSDPSVYVLFPLKERENEYLLVWTTTPWTLPANVAVAVKPDAVYTQYLAGGKKFWAHKIPNELANSRKFEKTSLTKKGKELVGLEYEPLYPLQKNVLLPIKNHTVLSANFVSTGEGTGLVHVAPTFGEDDFNLVFAKGMKENYVLPHTVTDDGEMADGTIGQGLGVKEADKIILDDLSKRGLLLHLEKVEHEYPFCWRCSSALIYFARRSWFFEVSRIRKELVAANETVNWFPEYLKEGRFGNWLSEAKDWSISRDRFWSTPLPIWRCEDRHITVAGSLKDLNDKRYFKNTFILVRHGGAKANREGWIASGEEKGKFISLLMPDGIKKVEKTAEALNRNGVDIIYTSPYKRAKDTAAIIAKKTGAKIVVDKRLEEIQTGQFDHKPMGEYFAFFKTLEEKFTKIPDGGESRMQVRKRIYGFIREIDRKHNGKRIVIVSHGDPLWMLEAALSHSDYHQSLSLKYPTLGSYKEVRLDNYPTDGYGFTDIHRPYADSVILACEKCGKPAKRIPDVADVWFDSGAMPFAQDHWPFAQSQKSNAAARPESFPADFVCEGIDQTRGWFYTLMATSVMLGLGAPYKNVISHGLVLDKYGQKMSKSKGNVVDPWSTINKFGIDSVRWYFYTVNAPAEPKNFDDEEIAKVLRRLIFTIYNSFVFLNLYGKGKISLAKTPTSPNILDRWILARIGQLAGEVEEKMDKYDFLSSGQAIEVFIDDLSRWYIRRSRRRFQHAHRSFGEGGRPDDKADWERASATLAYVLLQLSKIMAPFIPFFSEALYQSLRKSYSFDAKDSVHLEEWPVSSSKSQAASAKLTEGMEEIRKLASAVLAKRAEVGIKVRQPLASLEIKNKIEKVKNFEELLGILGDEVNVRSVVVDSKIKDEFELDTEITPELRAEGILRELVRIIQDLRQDAGCVPKDKIELWISAPKDVQTVAENFQKQLLSDVNAKKVFFGKAQKFDAELETKIDSLKLWVGIKKL